jgi:signal transduction histidine kinase
LSFDANKLTSNSVKNWRKKRVYKEHWNKEEFIAWTKSMMGLGQVQSQETYQGSSTAPESLNLHFVPFKQGMLYVGDVSPLDDEKLELVKTLAEAFSIAYARYEDFKNLEKAKNKIESTLNELKAAQSQLVQAEKMASLGELTAGIAHEIQNPLNFVNNFSEVSTELLEEVKEEIENGNIEEIKAITEDVIQNLEKILHHGKRADGIVKGMLQHSRGSSGQKELTDINALADEYLRLSYHGLRAKDKSFNADFKLEADKSLPKIEVVPQDIGRVLLNLINNAFYAVSEKAKQNQDGYKPSVIVSTKNQGNKIEICVKDNGNGIPESVKDKIFQPFFTTKPTGQGTGLGLSLSYDIVKAHGGNIKVNTKEGKGTNFILVLPS